MSNPTTREKLREEWIQSEVCKELVFNISGPNRYAEVERRKDDVADYWLDKLESELTLRERAVVNKFHDLYREMANEPIHNRNWSRAMEGLYQRILTAVPPTSEDNLNEQ